MFLSALLNQSHNQQSAKKKNVFTLITVNYYRKVTVVNTVTQIFWNFHPWKFFFR